MGKTHKPKLSELIPLDEVHKHLPRPPASATPGTWYRDGVCGVRLRAVSVGGKFHTCERWLFDFFEAVAAARHEKRFRWEPKESTS